MRIAVFCSGNGTNLQAIIDSIRRGELKGVEIALVVSDNVKAFALVRAKKSGIKTILVEPGKFVTKNEFEKEIIRYLKIEKVDLLVLAGFMRIVGKQLLEAYKNRIINIHPAILPSFKGAHGIKDAFDYGVKVTGVTVHFVDDKMDHGPIILQESIPIKEGESLDTLEERIHKVEHKLYYRAIGLIADKRIRIVGRKARIIG